MDKSKTQTRRIAKHHQRPRREIREDGTFYINQIVQGDGSGWVDTSDRVIYYIGQEMAVQPGRGMKAIGRIRITGLRHEDVREISEEDAKAEGFIYPRYFWHTWIAMHDKPLLREVEKYESPPYHGLMAIRPAERYQAWVIEFELVGGDA